MKFTPWSLWPIEPRDASGAPMGEGRPEGLHLGDIIHAMKAERGETTGPIPGEQDAIRLQAGFLHEASLEYIAAGMPQDVALELAFKRYLRPLRANVVKQVRTEKDGILMTPDGMDQTEGVLESYKLTWKSMRKFMVPGDGDEPWEHDQDMFEEHQWPWLVQEQAYCLAMGVDTVRFIVYFVGGDYSYKPGHGPQVRTATAVFTPEELQANWNRVLAYRDMIEGSKE